MATDFLKLFTSLGLSPNEAKVYLANLELGPTSAQALAKQAGLSRTATYDIINALRENGLVSMFKTGKKTLFSAEDPDRAVAYFRSNVRKLRTRLEDFERVIPELKMLVGGDRPTVRFYEGQEALHALFTDLVSSNAQQFDEMSNFDDIYAYLDKTYLYEVRKIVDPSRIRTRILHRGKLRREPREMVQYCELSPEIGMFHGDIWIYADRVAFVQFRGKLLAVIIESLEFADTARALYEAAWRASSHN